MLTKRTNILFDERLFQELVLLAKKNSTSVGNLVRKAVIRVYFTDGRDSEKQKAFREIMRLKKGLGRASARQIRELITYGRRY